MGDYANVEEDFLGVAFASPLVHAKHVWQSGGSGTVGPLDSDSSAPGMIRLSGAIANRYIRLGNVSRLWVDSYRGFKVRIRQSSTSNIAWRVGFGQDISSSTFGTAGIYLQHDSSADASVHVITRNASTSTDVDTNVSAVASFVTYEASRAGSSWDFYRATSFGSRAHLGRCSSNIPTGQALSFGVFLDAPSIARDLDIDLIHIYSNDLEVR